MRWMVVGLVGACAAALCTAAAGCGGESDASDSTAALRITKGFGHEVLWSKDAVPLDGRDTLLRQLRSEHSVEAVYHGAHVNSIDGRADRADAIDADVETAWVTNVNGIETDVYPVEYRLYPGDVVQWDLRDWYVTLDVRATVGAFPQTFTRGVFGKRFPVKLVCQRATSTPCQRIQRKLTRAGVPTDGAKLQRSQLPPAGNPQRAKIYVGDWRWLRDRRWADRIDKGARYSGVFARFAPDAKSLRLLDWNAHHIRTTNAGTGLVAAMRPTEEDLMWMITGVDDQGVERASQALDPNTLRDAYALAITDDGPVKLPLPPVPH